MQLLAESNIMSTNHIKVNNDVLIEISGLVGESTVSLIENRSDQISSRAPLFFEEQFKEKTKNEMQSSITSPLPPVVINK